MKLKFPSSGLYVITKTEGLTPQQTLDSVSAAIRGGAKVIQFRDKKRRNPVGIARSLLSICRQSCIPFIVNDDIELAARIGADGVHLGKDDQDIDTAKNLLGSESIVGISCYSSPDQARVAQRRGASYVAFGRFFPSKSKSEAPLANPDVLIQARLHIPVVAIGGITPDNGKILLDAGFIALGFDAFSAIERAQDYTWNTLRNGYRPGKGQYIPDRLFRRLSENGEPAAPATPQRLSGQDG